MVWAEPAERRIPPILFGTVVFLASELLLFGGLFAAYFALRARAAAWPPPGVELDPVLPSIGTALLVASSATYQAGVVAGRGERLGGLRRWVAATFLLGAAFLVVQAIDAARLGFTVSSDAYGTMFYALTGAHALHVAAGLVLMLLVLLRAAQGAYRGGRVEGAHAVGLYWHFVDAVWIGLYATLWVLR
ncbi:MAG: cytochrome b [Actinomycetota bacterium]|jgi:cytochrome c oxidase subunit 3|nr:MAG: cytochrome b [Actinomycetota bacterium]